MKKKKMYASVILLSFLTVGIQPALATKWVLGPDHVPPQIPETIGEWDPVERTFTLAGSTPPGDYIEIIDDNLTLDGAEYTVYPSSTDPGVDFYERSNITVKNLEITGGGSGISVRFSNNCTVTNNTVSTCKYGIWLAGSSNNTVTDNTINSSVEAGIWLQEGLLGDRSDNNTLTSNTITDVLVIQKNGIHIQNSIGNNLTSNTVKNCFEGILLISSNGTTLTSNDVSDNTYGIKLSSSTGNTLTSNITTGNGQGINITGPGENSLTNNNTSNNIIGIRLYQATDNVLTNNTTSYNRDGIYLSNNSSGNSITNNTSEHNAVLDNLGGAGIYIGDSSSITLINNIFSNNEYGVKFVNCSNSSLTGNLLSNNVWGIWLDPSNNNTITNNDIENNDSGIYLDSSDNNQIYNNNLIGNTTPAEINGGSGNEFGVESTGGNYWSNYEGVDDGSNGRIPGDGIGDTDIPHLGVDYYPFINEDGWLPAANAGADQTVECACQTSEGTQVTLDGSGSTGAETYTWTGPFEGSPITVTEPELIVTLNENVCLGEHEINLVINDGEFETETDTVIITVVDTTPPDVIPPGDVTIGAMGPDPVPVDDERIQAFLAGVSANDNCDPEPTITDDTPAEFPPGDTVVTFTATDASSNESTSESTVTIVEAAESNLRIIPKIINREGRLEQILAVIRFPAGTAEEDIDIETPLVLYPGESPIGIEATSQRIVTWCMWGTLRVAVFARFPKDNVTAGVPENGPAELMVIGRFTDGQYFYGFDNVWICSWNW